MSFSQFSDQLIHEQFKSAQYQLLHKIGEGGFGKVFKATQINTGQTVAIKFLAIESHCEEQKKLRYIERFKRETSLSSKLQHPNIVRLLDKGQINDNLLYGVFEYVEGQSLREHLIQEGALNAVDAKDVMLQVLDALTHAHQNGIVHRDIKPANIMLSKTGAKTHAKILDFGIGTLTQDSRQPDFNTLTMTQETLGTPSYSAPEQLRGEPATAKTDLYVWGLVFLECLTGLPAVSGSSVAAVYHKQLSDMQVNIPSSLLGHPIAELLRRTLIKNATDRVITGEVLYEEVSQINMSNLVGVLADYKTQQTEDNTLVMRADGPTSSAMQHYTAHIERKQITVLAIRLTCKIIDNQELDLDVMDTLFKSQRNHCIDVATRYGGTHVGNLADSVLFYFGYPVTSDNDTRLCARTILDAMSDLTKRNALIQESHNVQINIHAGIHAGIFTTYANAMPEGHIANAAMTLAREAGERQVLCSAEARAILEPYSEFEHFGDLQLGASYSKERIFNLNGERRVEAFGFMRGTRNNHDLVGRNEELETTLSVIKKSNTESRLTHIHGEAGIGKSRLLQEIRANAPQYQHLVAQCLPEHQNNALYPILNLVRYLYNTSHLTTDKALTLFSEVLIQHDNSIDLEQTLPILLIWLNIELSDELTASTLAPDAQKALLFKSLTALLMSQKFSISEYKLYIVEDIHWADSTTLEFIHHFGAAIRTGDVLISTSRQKIPSQLQDLTLLEVNLKKLTEQATEDFIVKLFDEQAVSRNVLDVLINRTDGIPLFIEELVDMLKQKALVGVIDGEINFASPDKLEQVPSSLRESLQQKLDGLVHAKETAQLAATIGREFEYELLVAASSLSENQIQNDLNELIAKDLIVHQRHVNNDSYIFKHALVRDAAYESMQADTKSSMHSTIAKSLSEMYQVSSAIEPNVISYHYEEANCFEPASYWSIKSITKLVNKYSYRQALINAEYTENLLQKINDNDKELGLKGKLLDAIYPCYVGTYGTASPQTFELRSKLTSTYTNLHPNTKELKESIKDKIDWINFMELFYCGGGPKKIQFGNELLEKYEKANDYNKQAVTLSHLILSYLFEGDISSSIQCFIKIKNKLLHKVNREYILNQYGVDIEPFCYSIACLTFIHSNEIELADECSKKAIETCSGHSACHATALAYLFRALLKAYLDLKDEVINIGNFYFSNIFEEGNFCYYQVYLNFLLACFKGDLNDSEEIIMGIAKSSQDFATGWYIVFLGRSLLSKKQHEHAREVLQFSLEKSKANRELTAIPVILNALALIEIDSNCYSEASEYLNESIKLSTSQGNLFFLQQAKMILNDLPTTQKEK